MLVPCITLYFFTFSVSTEKPDDMLADLITYKLIHWKEF